MMTHPLRRFWTGWSAGNEDEFKNMPILICKLPWKRLQPKRVYEMACEFWQDPKYKELQVILMKDIVICRVDYRTDDGKIPGCRIDLLWKSRSIQKTFTEIKISVSVRRWVFTLTKSGLITEELSKIFIAKYGIAEILKTGRRGNATPAWYPFFVRYRTKNNFRKRRSEVGSRLGILYSVRFGGVATLYNQSGLSPKANTSRYAANWPATQPGSATVLWQTPENTQGESRATNSSTGFSASGGGL